ncbi:Ig-like domain-containing protein [Pseudoalteromonas denitrificans]|uniref:Big-1 domain-containing protein n=1 Tax=Pseudoalteromonas denitrificans DSM 6059 TaxID=1123010 RepID=A0A1I1RI10_9GAMM|nr:Ig-like domain-containing protein [Pseudoalteromonas denitrificans]SFD30120.1 hypothetical protein SAMN02745724_04128 [Pseudoalteromonas denitrificans DSM 6059]
MKSIKLSFVFFTSLLLSACNGSSGDNEVPVIPDPNAPVIMALSMLDENCQLLATPSITAGKSFCIQAKLIKNNTAVTNTTVNFDAPLGSLSVTSKLTDANGIAQVLLNSSVTDLGSSDLTATASDVSATTSYEFLKSNEPDPNAPIEITISVLDENCQLLATPSIYAGKSFCIQAKLLKNNIAVPNTSVSFDAPLGSLSLASKLSDTNGIAQVLLSSLATDLGSANLTVTASDISATASYEFLKSNEPDPNAPIQISVAIFNEQCNPVNLPSFNAGDTACIKANIAKNNEPVSGLAITFDAPLGSLRQTSKLSDKDGNAIVYLDSDTSSVGASTLTATLEQTSATIQYEFINNDTGTPTLPQINVKMLKNGIANNQFKQGESVQVEVVLTDSDSLPLTNQIVKFTAESGSLDASSKLTNQEGITQATLTAATDNLVGAAVFTASYTLADQSQTISQQFNYQVLDADIIDRPKVRAGHFDQNGVFVESLIGVTLTNKDTDGSVTLSAGGTIGLKVALIDENDNRILTPTSITFTSNCVSNQQAKIDEQVLTINGEARATYEDLSCAGSTGNQDQIIATVSGSAENITLTQTVNLQAETLGAIEFVSAEPDSIVLKGTGGQGKQEISTLSFLVKGKLGNPLAQQEILFSLDTVIGGLNISPISAFTNSLGQVSTKVTSGNVPTVVRVTAQANATDLEGNAYSISTQSDLLSVNTGLADQNSITLATTNHNPEGHNRNGEEATITAWLADSFNNPVPDGTTVNFTTEGGQISPSCQTTNGSCFVKWKSAEPKVFNHRITILATAIGHETFFDTNGNNVFDNSDGEPVVDTDVSSGFGRSEYLASGFIDMPEAWRDDNENNIRDPGELFIDFERDSQYDVNDDNYTSQDSKFNGPHCISTSKCGENISKTINVRKALKMIMASSDSNWSLYEKGQAKPIISNYSPEQASGTINSIQRNASKTYQLFFSDTALQTMPSGTTVSITASQGEVAGKINYTVPNTIGAVMPLAQADKNTITISEAISKSVYGGYLMEFTVTNNLTSAALPPSILNFTISSPSGILSGSSITIPFVEP